MTLTDPSPPPRRSLPPASAGAASLVALATAIGSIISAWQSYENGKDTQRAAYEALRRADADKTSQLRELARGQEELKAWVGELAARLDERANVAEKAIRKVVRPKTPIPAVTPPPPAPASAEVRPSEPLPPFDQLSR